MNHHRENGHVTNTITAGPTKKMEEGKKTRCLSTRIGLFCVSVNTFWSSRKRKRGEVERTRNGKEENDPVKSNDARYRDAKVAIQYLTKRKKAVFTPLAVLPLTARLRNGEL